MAEKMLKKHMQKKMIAKEMATSSKASPTPALLFGFSGVFLFLGGRVTTKGTLKGVC